MLILLTLLFQLLTNERDVERVYFSDENVDDDLLDHSSKCQGFVKHYIYYTGNRREGSMRPCRTCKWIAETKLNLIDDMNERDKCE